MKRTFPLLVLSFFLLLSPISHAAVPETDNGEGSKGVSGLPIPRFASLRASDVNLRTGPGTRYPIEWVLTHQGMPVEITAEYEMWRRIRNVDGDEGWVHKNALSGHRAAIITGGKRELHDSADETSAITAHLEEGAIGQLISCSKDWCKLKFEGVKGYAHKNDFWGSYPKEIF
jgi:SH3-like domain-containing protein